MGHRYGQWVPYLAGGRDSCARASSLMMEISFLLQSVEFLDDCQYNSSVIIILCRHLDSQSLDETGQRNYYYDTVQCAGLLREWNQFELNFFFFF